MKLKKMGLLIVSATLLTASMPLQALAQPDTGDAVTDLSGFQQRLPNGLYQDPHEGEISTQASICSQPEWEMLYYVNSLRMDNGLEPLSMFYDLQLAAYTRSTELPSVFSHTRPDGSDWSSILSGISNYYAWGENIAMGHSDPFNIFSLWYNSPGHYANMVHPSFNHIGIGNAYSIYWTQDFIGGCSPSSIAIEGNPTATYVLPSNLSLVDMNLTLTASCVHGTSYLPVIVEMCSGYDNTKIGTLQPVTISYQGAVTTINVLTAKPWYFKDVSSSDWFFENVFDIYNRDLMTGLNDYYFAPSTSLCRAQFATILYRMAGSPAVEYTNLFPDIPNNNSFYQNPAVWAGSSGIITGYQNGYFGPNDDINREQLATILYRYNGSPAYSTSSVDSILSQFPDNGAVSSYAQTAIAWAIDNGIITGSGGYIVPQGTASRAECATMILRYVNKF